MKSLTFTFCKKLQPICLIPEKTAFRRRGTPVISVSQLPAMNNQDAALTEPSRICRSSLFHLSWVQLLYLVGPVPSQQCSTNSAARTCYDIALRPEFIIFWHVCIGHHRFHSSRKYILCRKSELQFFSLSLHTSRTVNSCSHTIYIKNVLCCCILQAKNRILFSARFLFFLRFSMR